MACMSQGTICQKALVVIMMGMPKAQQSTEHITRFAAESKKGRELLVGVERLQAAFILDNGETQVKSHMTLSTCTYQE